MLRLVSYNVHSCVGLDRVYSPERIAAVIGELRPDIAGLQELADGGTVEPGAAPKDELARLTGMTCIPGITLSTHRGPFGNALLSRHPVLDVRRFDLSVPGAEPRGAIDVDIDCAGRALRVVVTHLGLRARERGAQVARLLERLGEVVPRPVEAPLVLMGDFNEWSPASPRLGRLRRAFGRSHARPSYPASRPVFALDRIWVAPYALRRAAGTHRSALSRVASDHLPVWATVELDGAAP